MKQAILLATVLAGSFVAAPVAATHTVDEHKCRIDAGAPSVMYDADADGDQGPALGGCMLVQALDEGKELVGYESPDPTFCRIMYDEDGDGTGIKTVEDGIPTGSDVWAKCDALAGTVTVWLE